MGNYIQGRECANAVDELHATRCGCQVLENVAVVGPDESAVTIESSISPAVSPHPQLA
jgi:hypothetical protein